MIKRFYKKIIYAAAALLFVLAISAAGIRKALCAYMFDNSIKRPDAQLPQNSETFDTLTAEDGSTSWPKSWMRAHKTDWRPVQAAAEDGLTLRGYYFPAAEQSDVTAIIMHGYRNTALDLGVYAELYRDVLGFNVLLPDARSHGVSDGEYLGFGYLDRLDLKQWIEFAIAETGADTKIVLHGVSMGGAAVMMCAGETLPQNVVCAVDDCGYTSVDKQLRHVMKLWYHIDWKWLLNAVSRMCEKRAGYSFFEASALEQIRQTKIPVLFIHGGADTFVPASMVHELYEACPSYKELYIPPHSEHAQSYADNPEAYTEKVCAFVKKCLE